MAKRCVHMIKSLKEITILHNKRLPMTPIVELRGVVKKYGRKVAALKRVDLSVEEGEAFGLVGPNGAGKTTLIKLILGLLKPTAGTVRVWGYESAAPPRALKLRIGYLLEEPGLYDVLTVEENLTFWAKVYGVDQE
ncbi:MAG: ATP-binding cassette domain-containing protein, partial [Candidatus Diapherotrites archaeon]|nr:ATP-binding cassette domain-containing protein [Candidatus Diapherotrites archaeon]